MDFTHAYLPTEKFDDYLIDKNYIFDKKGNTYCAFIEANDFHIADDPRDDINQSGKNRFWITELVP